MLEKEPNLLEIVTYGHPVLVQKAKEIENIDQNIFDLAENMILTMHTAPGIGLAAPQVNQSLRLICADLSFGEKRESLLVLINPELIENEGQDVLEEGCLSVPGINEKVNRPYRVCVKGTDLQGSEKTIEAEGLLARVLCHEIDHINGKLFFEHLSPLKRNLIRKKLNKSL
jgi:peptide deformylase